MSYSYTSEGVMLLILGVLGVVFNSKNLMMMLMSIELMLLAVSFLFLSMSRAMDNLIGQMFTLMMLTVAAAESAMGLAMFVVYYSMSATIAVNALNLLSG